ncbi:MAG: DUF4340 domain-containing protein, partial [Deltaproteobacteria bacterium]|nr:DUF4340 domain-containing protein [Deltaproteobacteria bacterium]
RLGKEAPSPPGAVYAELEGGSRGSQTYVVTQELYEALALPPGELRGRNLVPYWSLELQSFALTGPEVSWTLSRGGWGGRTAGAFLLTAKAPIGKVRASRRALAGWLRGLGNLEVEQFTTVPATDDPTAHTLVFTPLEEGKPVGKLVIGGACEGGGTLVVRRAPRPAAGCVPKPMAAALLPPAEIFVDRHVVGTAVSDMVELELSSGDITVDVARVQDGWHMRKPDDQQVAKGIMKTLVDGLGGAEGKRLEPAEAADLAQLGLAEPRAAVRIIGLPERAATGATERIERLEVGAEREGFVYVRRTDDGAVLAVAADVAGLLLPRPSLLRSTEIYDVPLSRIRQLTLDCGGKRQRMSRDARGAWTLLEPKLASLGADVTLANGFADLLRTLQGVRWASERPEPRQQLDRPWCTISAEADLPTEGGDQEAGIQQLQVVLGAEAQGGYFAQRDGADAVFVAPRALGVAAGHWLLDRAALMIVTGDVERLTVVGRGERRLTVLPQGGKWVVEGEPASRAGERVKAGLDQLLAEGVVRLGPATPSDGMGDPVLRLEAKLRSEAEPVVLTVGAGEVFRDTSVFFVRRSGLEATFAVAQSRLRPLIDAL